MNHAEKNELLVALSRAGKPEFAIDHLSVWMDRQGFSVASGGRLLLSENFVKENNISRYNLPSYVQICDKTHFFWGSGIVLTREAGTIKLNGSY